MMPVESERESSAIKTLIDELNGVIECDVLPPSVNDLIERCILNLSSLTRLDTDPKRLLSNIKRLLIAPSSASKLDYDLVLELLSKLVSIVSFDDVLKVFSIDDLTMSLKSRIPSLVKAANKVIERSYPKGLFANSEIFDIQLDLYFDPSLDISVINSIENSFSSLSSDELVRRRILVNNMPLLMAVRKNYDPISLARLLEILNIQCSYMAPNEFNEKLFIIRPEEILKSLDIDVVMFIHILLYYTKLLDEVNVIESTGQSHEWILKYLLPIAPTFGKTFAEKEKYSDVKYFARSYLFKFFRKLSYLDDDSIFRSLDIEYIHISPENEYITDLLSFVNPRYLLDYYPKLVTQFAMVVPSKLGIVRNLVTDPQCFALIKGQITADSILAMPYMEQMVLLQRLSQFSHCARYLLHDLPKVMSNLISNENGEVIESETVALRRETIENLLKFDSEDLNVWNIPLREELVKISGGRLRNDIHTSVASSYA